MGGRYNGGIKLPTKAEMDKIERDWAIIEQAARGEISLSRAAELLEMPLERLRAAIVSKRKKEGIK